MTLLAALAFLQQGELTDLQRSILKVAPPRTGTNGYEEFVDAAVLVESERMVSLRSYLGAWAVGQTKPPENRNGPAGLRVNATRLDVLRLIVEESKPIYLLIEKGLSKQVRYPGVLSINNLFPEFTSFTRIGALISYRATVDFAEGRGAKASQSLLTGYRFARSLESMTSVGHYSCFRIERMLGGVVDRHVSLLPASFAGGVTALPVDHNVVKTVLDIQIGETRELWREFLKEPEGDNETELKKLASGMSSRRADELYDAHLTNYEGFARAARRRADEPESEWLKPLEGAAAPETSVDAQSSEGKLIVAFRNMMRRYVDEAGGMTETYILEWSAIGGIQRRILAHTAAAVRYRWETGEFPSVLSKVYGREPQDPFNDSPYRIESRGGGIRISLDVKGRPTVTLGSAKGTSDQGVINP